MHALFYYVRRLAQSIWLKGSSMGDWLTRTVRAAGIERALKAGQVLFRASQRTTGLFEIIRGSVRPGAHRSTAHDQQSPPGSER
jgi:hypothetical protein